MVKHLYLMRHGQTLFNVYRRIQEWCDSPLTEVGINQAIAARKLIEGIDFDHYYCSTAERASDTLELVTDYKVPYTRLKGLKECYFGVFEGQSEDLNPPFDKYDDVFTIYGGESGAQLKKRMMDTLTEVMEKEDLFKDLDNEEDFDDEFDEEDDDFGDDFDDFEEEDMEGGEF